MSGILNAVVGAGGASAPTDAYFKNTTLLLHGDGTNGAQNNNFVDSSSNAFTITRNGNTTQGTFSPFSQTGWSNYFNGSSYLSVASNAAFAPGTGDFAIQCWAYFDDISATRPILQNDTIGTSGTDKFWFAYQSNALNFGQHSTSNKASVSWTPSVGQWYHLAVSRVSGTVYMWINGVGQTVTNSTIFNGTSFGQNGVTVGAGSTPWYFLGYLSNLQYQVGTGFTTLTLPTSPILTPGTNAKLLTCQSNRFLDNSTNAFAITPSGSPSVQAFSPFAPTAAYSATTNGGSGYFDGSGDYLSASTNAAFNFGTGDATVEFWFNAPGAQPGNFPGIVSSSDYNTSGSSSLRYSNTGYSQKIFMYLNGASPADPVISSASTIPYNTWAHVALVRQGTSLKLYLNGTLDASVTISASLGLNFGSGELRIGRGFDVDGSGGYFFGYISNIRLVKGTAVYTSNFTPLTAPLTAITNTQLLLKCTNAGIIDNAAKNDLETVGNAQISTTQSKFGGSSMYFDGTGDWLYFPTTPIAALGDFTIEGWFYSATATSAYQIVFALGGNSSLNSIASVLLALGNSSTGPASCVSLLCSTSGSSWALDAKSSNGVITDSAWYHFAVVRSGGTISVYINGTSVISSTAISATTSLYVGTVNRIGAQPYSSPSALNGFIDDFRVTNGYARYTSNFTVPSAAFPDK